MERLLARLTGCIALFTAFATIAAEPNPPATPRQPSPLFAFRDLPPQYQLYFEQARVADRLPDLLSRCLATPDLPGTHWPQGYGAAHCRYHYQPVPSLESLSSAIERRNFASINDLLDRLVEQHESGDERIHRFFRQFDRSWEWRDAADAWVKAEPVSAYAALAHGAALQSRGWAARGGAVAKDTSQRRLREMTTWFDAAEGEYRRAIALEPRLADAYAGLISIGRADRPAVAGEAIALANKVTPGCMEVARSIATALAPRWGGSSGDQHAYLASIEPLVASRPLLAHTRSYVDYDAFVHDSDLTSAQRVSVIRDAVDASGMEDTLLIDAAGDANDPDAVVDRIARRLEASRFEEAGDDVEHAIIEFIRPRDPAWADVRQQRRLAPAGSDGPAMKTPRGTDPRR